MAQIKTIDHTCLALTSEAQLYTLYDQLNAMSAVVQVSQLEFSLATNPAEPQTYLYKITLADGRIWRQRIDFSADAADPFMTFSVSDEWKISEFALQRPIRDSLVGLYSSVALRALDVVMDP